MQQREPLDTIAGTCRRVALACVVLAFLMVPAAMALAWRGLPAAVAALGGGVAVVVYVAVSRMRAYGVSLGDFLTSRGITVPYGPPWALLLVGAVFWVPGLYALVAVGGAGDEARLRSIWFGTTFLLMGGGVALLGVSGWLKRAALRRAVARLDESLGRRPDDAELRLRRGVLLGEQGKLEQAIDDFTEVLQLEPQHVEALLERGDLRFRLGRHEQALSDYSAAVRADPANVEARAKRGWTHQELGDEDAAKRDFAEVDRMQADDDSTRT